MGKKHVIFAKKRLFFQIIKKKMPSFPRQTVFLALFLMLFYKLLKKQKKTDKKTVKLQYFEGTLHIIPHEIITKMDLKKALGPSDNFIRVYLSIHTKTHKFTDFRRFLDFF